MSAIEKIKKNLKHIDTSNPDFIKNPSKYLIFFSEELKKLSPSLYSRLINTLSEDNPDISAIEKILYETNIIISGNTSIKDSFDRLTVSIDYLDGVGAKTASTLKKHGVKEIQDILLYFPFKYEIVDTDLSSERLFIHGKLLSKNIIKTKYGKHIFQASFQTDEGFYYAVWFNFSKKYPGPLLKEGGKYSLFGKYISFNGKPAAVHPKFVDKSERGKVKTYYSLPANIKNMSFSKIVKNAFIYIGNNIVETLPEHLMIKYNYPGIKNALQTIHFPESGRDVNLLNSSKHPAFVRFVYEELFYLQLGMLIKKLNYNKVFGIKYNVKDEFLEQIKNYIPFKLTRAQKRALADIFNDMKSDYQMNRLLQGDVGSGKTIVAFIAAVVSVLNGYQVAIIAPTEVLAEQHYVNLMNFLKGDFSTVLLTGSTPKKEKNESRVFIENGNIDFIVGTHSVIRDEITFKKLGLAIIDEQHRFGVMQRKSLVDKGYNPDILLMTATPIPRTLALTLYGDLNISIIDEMPPGRTPVETKSFPACDFQKVLDYVENELEKGNKAYFVYPLIDESEKMDLKDATGNFEVIKARLEKYRVGLLHGKMKSDEKNKLMKEFRSGHIDVLVSTTVIEVGVDVPDATVMVIENAERFGLSQLHQLRGRVGRSAKKSYCYLIYSDNISEDGKKRIDSMVSTNDGFKLSEVDLEIRGPGDFFGTRQSGLPEFRFSNIVRDVKILNNARRDAEEILRDDPLLEKPKHLVLKEMLHFKWRHNLDLTGIG